MVSAEKRARKKEERKQRMNNALLSSQNMNWCTPQKFFDELNAEFHFTLDAAATEQSAKCDKYFTPETDGLKQSWSAGGGGILQPTVWTKSRGLGTKSISRIETRNNNCAAHSGAHGHIIFSRFHIRKSRNQIFARSVDIHRRKRKSTDGRQRTCNARAFSVNVGRI